MIFSNVKHTSIDNLITNIHLRSQSLDPNTCTQYINGGELGKSMWMAPEIQSALRML